jgi:hypothetical protein
MPAAAEPSAGRRITEIVPGEQPRPGFEQHHQPARGDMRRDHLLRGERDAESVDGQLQPEVFEVGDDRSLDGDVEPRTSFDELPLVGCLVTGPAPADALVGCEVARMIGGAAPGEIVRRGDDDLTQIWTELDGDHILLDDLADADRSIVAAGHEIHDLIVQRDVEHDIGVRVMERSQVGPQEQLRGGPEAVNPNDAGRASAELPCLSDRGSKLLDRGPDPLKQLVAGLGQGNPPSGAMEETDADPLLEPANQLAQGR